MYPIVFYLAAAWTVTLLGVTALLVVIARSTLVRVLALDTLTLILVALLVLFAHALRSPHFLDAALALALLSFIGTLAIAQYYSDRKPFL